MNEEGKYRLNKMKDIETPTTTILTNDIQPEYINFELLRKIEKKFIVNCPLFEVYKNLEIFEKAKEYYSKNRNNENVTRNYLHNFADFDNSYRYMNVRNVLTNSFSLNINKNITIKQNNCTIVFSIDDFSKCVEIFEPDIFCIPSEEVKINEDVGKKKKIRIITLMNEFLKKIKMLKDKQIICESLCILSVPSTINLNKDLMEETLNKYNSVIDGYLLSGIGYEESNQVRTNHLKNVLSVLPSNKLKLIQLSIGSPIEILHSVFHGIDIIESNFPYELARSGKAINMDIKMETSASDVSKVHHINIINFKNEEIFIIDLNDSKYNMDYSTITNNSPRNESRSYIHHLLKCQELTANVILTYHNIHIYSLFFQEIQNQIKNNNFLCYISWFIEHHQLNL
ncbi:queuine tRNA-ribosyltransferase [Plasmodium gonderi]|uniref:Queuine tRNA-ribosyltransferase n=1 Tax=Plasmodium gonderi TaxID=77519 RepID=A0A1Y1JN65_PLAGO|nr:queuine tRNA-ribosyltransferase [Plasmodium gonderi]GAW82895.1 queuine tRNA-ribosyltransferase [Plasmodium gonderi]